MLSPVAAMGRMRSWSPWTTSVGTSDLSLSYQSWFSVALSSWPYSFLRVAVGCAGTRS
jgi:hypothetical protein